MSKKNLIAKVIAIDGTAASGKGTIVKYLSDIYHIDYLDTGKIYRLLAYQIKNKNLDLNDTKILMNTILELPLDKIKELDHQLKNEQIANLASKLASLSQVRQKLINIQRDFALNKSVVILDGRDIGTVIFPDAKLKLFITASVEKRAQRRFLQQCNILQLDNISYHTDMRYIKILEQIKKRDEQDMNRKIAPLVKAKDAIEIDSSDLSIEEVKLKVKKIVEEKFIELKST